MTTARPDQSDQPEALTGRALQHLLVDAASTRYAADGHKRFAYHFARGKLGGDPMFIELLRLGALNGIAAQSPTGQHMLDLGCGQAVLAAWLLAARQQFDAGPWPAGWPAPPRIAQLRAWELMPVDVARAQVAFAAEPCVQVTQADICQASFGQADVITILDVLHYLSPPQQDDVLRRARAALPPGGLLVMRVGDAAGGLRFRLSLWADQCITLARGHGWATLHARPLADWVQALQDLGFTVRTTPTPGGLPFANTFVIARLPAEGAAPGATPAPTPEAVPC